MKRRRNLSKHSPDLFALIYSFHQQAHTHTTFSLICHISSGFCPPFRWRLTAENTASIFNQGEEDLMRLNKRKRLFCLLTEADIGLWECHCTYPGRGGAGDVWRGDEGRGWPPADLLANGGSAGTAGASTRGGRSSLQSSITELIIIFYYNV